LKRQVVNRIRQFNKIPQQRRERMRPGIEKQYKQVAARFRKLGYSIPSLDDLIADPDGWLKTDLQPASVATDGPQETSLQRIVEDCYLRALSRFPDAEETEISVTFIEESETAADGIQSLLWALVNTKEFIITH